MISDVNRLFALCSRLVCREMHDGRDSDKYLRLLGVRLAHLLFENEKVYSGSFVFITAIWIIFNLPDIFRLIHHTRCAHFGIGKKWNQQK